MRGFIIMAEPVFIEASALAGKIYSLNYPLKTIC